MNVSEALGIIERLEEHYNAVVVGSHQQYTEGILDCIDILKDYLEIEE